MRKIRRILAALSEEDAQDLIEYGLLAAFISVTAVIALKAIGPLIVPLYEAVVASLTP